MSADSIRKIKANHIEYDGDYVHIIRNPMKRLRFSLICILSFIFAYIFQKALDFIGVFTVIGINPEDFFSAYVIIAFMINCLLTLVVDGYEIYTFPRIDVAAIKEYPDEKRVTVVLDEDRMKSSSVFLNLEN